jgi:hypothetical protein
MYIQDTKTGKIYQVAIKCTDWLQYGPNVNRIYKRLPLQDPPKFTQIGMFWFEMYTIWQPSFSLQQEMCKHGGFFWFKVC